VPRLTDGHAQSDRSLIDHLLAERDSERRRLAAQLHDGPQQTTTALRLLADGARHALDQGDAAQAREAVARIEQLALEAAEQLRLVSATLDPFALERRGLLDALAALPRTLAEGQVIDARFTGPPDPPRPVPARDAAVYAIAREFSSAAVAAGADRIHIELISEDGGLRLRIAAAGAGQIPGVQVQLLRHRARGTGGRLSISGSGPLEMELVVAA